MAEQESAGLSRPHYDPMAEGRLSDKNFYIFRMEPILKYHGHAVEFKNFRARYHEYAIPGSGGHVSPEYLGVYKGKPTGFHCLNLRMADEDDALRILRFMLSCCNGSLHPAIWFRMRSFGELVRVQLGLKAPVKAMETPSAESDTNYGPSAVLEKTYRENLRFKEDVAAVARRREELVADRIRAEAPALEFFGADGGKWLAPHLRDKLSLPEGPKDE